MFMSLLMFVARCVLHLQNLVDIELTTNSSSSMLLHSTESQQSKNALYCQVIQYLINQAVNVKPLC